MRISRYKFLLEEIITTAELAEKLGYNQAYVLRLAKEHLKLNEDYRSAGRRNYLFTPTAVTKLEEILAEKSREK